MGNQSTTLTGATSYASAGTAKTVWESIHPKQMQPSFRNKEHCVGAVALGLEAPSTHISTSDGKSMSQVPESISVDAAVATYLDEIRRFRAGRTIKACEHVVYQPAELGVLSASERIRKEFPRNESQTALADARQ